MIRLDPEPAKPRRGRHSFRTLILALAGLSWVPIVTGAWDEARAQCPLNHLDCTYRSLSSTAPAESLVFGQFDIGYNFLAGRFRNRVGGGREDAVGSSLRASDVFGVLGPAPGTPFELTAVVEAQCWVVVHCFDWGGRANVSTSLRTGSGAADTVGLQLEVPPCEYNYSVEREDYTPLRVRVVGVVGEPFPLFLESTANILSGAAAFYGRLRFEGLATGMTVVSCQGFQDAVTATRRTSWGSMKIRYR